MLSIFKIKYLKASNACNFIINFINIMRSTKKTNKRKLLPAINTSIDLRRVV